MFQTIKSMPAGLLSDLVSVHSTGQTLLEIPALVSSDASFSRRLMASDDLCEPNQLVLQILARRSARSGGRCSNDVVRSAAIRIVKNTHKKGSKM